MDMHVTRMTSKRLSATALYGHVERTGSGGGQTKTWTEKVMEDLMAQGFDMREVV